MRSRVQWGVSCHVTGRSVIPASLPPAGTKDLKKHQLTHAMGLAKKSTASAGKFTPSLVKDNFSTLYSWRLVFYCDALSFQPKEPTPKGIKKRSVSL